MAGERWRLYPFEWLALGMQGAVAGVLLAADLPAPERSLRRLAALSLTLGVGGALLGVGLQAVWRAASQRGVRDYLDTLARPGWWTLWARLWLACMLASNAYFSLKVYVPRLNDARYDDALWRLDRLLHLGASPTSLSMSVLPDGFVTGALDVWYGLWLLTLFAGIAFFAASERDEIRRGAVFSCVALWGLGALGYVLVPVVGPVFAFPGFFRALPLEMPIAAAIQDSLWTHYQQVAAGQGVADYTRGVGALPSLHVGFHALFALWLRTVAPRLFPWWVALALLTFVGSVRTGWHYAVDGYVGLAFAALVFWLARRLEGRVSD